MKLNINLNKANDCIKKGLYNDAIKLCDEEINLDPKNSIAWIIKGLANLQMGKYRHDKEYNFFHVNLSYNFVVLLEREKGIEPSA